MTIPKNKTAIDDMKRYAVDHEEELKEEKRALVAAMVFSIHELDQRLQQLEVKTEINYQATRSTFNSFGKDFSQFVKATADAVEELSDQLPQGNQCCPGVRFCEHGTHSYKNDPVLAESKVDLTDAIELLKNCAKVHGRGHILVSFRAGEPMKLYSKESVDAAIAILENARKKNDK